MHRHPALLCLFALCCGVGCAAWWEIESPRGGHEEPSRRDCIRRKTEVEREMRERVWTSDRLSQFLVWHRAFGMSSIAVKGSKSATLGQEKKVKEHIEACALQKQ